MEEFCLETQRMMIRSFTPEDAAYLHEILGDDETMEHCEPSYDFEKTKEPYMMLPESLFQCSRKFPL